MECIFLELIPVRSEELRKDSAFTRLRSVIFYNLIPWFCGLRFWGCERKLIILEKCIPLIKVT
jgi:hypothetical protein